jgi:hypothetical protein
MVQLRDDQLGAINNPLLEVYVNPQTGSDTSGDGSVSLPFATIERARQLIGNKISVGSKVRLYLYPHAGGVAYNEDAFWDTPNINGVFEIIGVGTTPKDGTVYTVSSVDITHRIITLSVNPTVTNGDLSGWQVEVVSSSNAVLPGVRRDVLWNIGSAIYVAELPTRWDGTTFTRLASASTVRFVEPSVRINTTGRVTGVQYNEARTLVGGNGGINETGLVFHPAGELVLNNLHFYAPDGNTNQVQCTGCVRFVGVLQTQNAASVSQKWVFNSARVLTGVGNSGVVDLTEGLLRDQNFGSMISMRARVPGTNPIRPGIIATLSHFRGPLCCGQSQFRESYVVLTNGGRSCFDAIGLGSAFPHSALYIGKTHFISESSTSTNGLWLYGPSGGWGMEINYSSWAEVVNTIRHLGAGSDPVRVRHHSFCNFGVSGGTPVIEDVAFTTGLTLQYGSQVRLILNDGASFKSASVGQNVPTVRNLTSSPMVALTEVTGSEFCVLQRSS